MWFTHSATAVVPPPLAGDSEHVLITGAASGIGHAFAEALSQRKQPLLLVDRNGDSLNDLRDNLHSAHQAPVDAWPADVGDPGTVDGLIQHCRDTGIAVSVLINCAGVADRTSFVEQERPSFRGIIDTNIGGVVELTRAFLPGMIARGHGAVINVCSTAAFEPMPRWAVYGATKAFIQSFTESLQREVEGTGVYVASVCPGITRTPFLQTAGLNESEVPLDAQTPEQVVAEALQGIDRRRALIVTGFVNRARVNAQRVSLRSVIHGVRSCLRKMRLAS
jgi:short-subunit dehydrogenase